MTSHRVPETSRTGWGWGAGGAPSSGRAGGRGSRGSEGILGSPSGCVGGGGAHGGVGEDPGRELLLSLLEAGPGAAVQGVDPLEHHDPQHRDAGEKQGHQQHERGRRLVGVQHHQRRDPATEPPTWDANGLENKEHILDEENEEENEEIE